MTVVHMSDGAASKKPDAMSLVQMGWSVVKLS